MDKEQYLKDGYIIIEDCITPDTMKELDKLAETANPFCGIGPDKTFKSKHLDNETEACLWWSDMLTGPAIDSIMAIAKEYVEPFMTEPNVRNIVFSVVASGSTIVCPHTDIPEDENEDTYDASATAKVIQCLIPLQDNSEINGATALCPGSHAEIFFRTEDRSNEIPLNMWGEREHIQPVVRRGSILMFDSRILHSIMPNRTNENRMTIMMTWLTKELYDKVKKKMDLEKAKYAK
jgi:hypothetical protein